LKQPSSVGFVLLCLAALMVSGLLLLFKAQPSLAPILIDAYSPPKIVTPALTVDLGLIPMEEHVGTRISISNHGGQLLSIKKVSSSCGCTIAKLKNSHLKAGASTVLSIEMDTRLKLGPIQKTIDIDSNDPLHPRLSVKLIAQVHPTEKQKTHGGMLKVADRLALFKGTCKTCHVDKGVGKTGQELFIADCGMCHGVDAKGGVSPGLLTLDWEKPATVAYARGIIANGSPNNPAMAPFSKKFHGGPLSEDQIDSLVNFLQYQASLTHTP
jgi:Protein of unknown function (DUF1573)/Cytochrome C oxidase, cbb3-type, subunit III